MIKDMKKQFSGLLYEIGFLDSTNPTAFSANYNSGIFVLIVVSLFILSDRNEDDDDDNDKFRVSFSVIFPYLILFFLRWKIALKSVVNKLLPSPPSFSTIQKGALLNTLSSCFTCR